MAIRPETMQVRVIDGVGDIGGELGYRSQVRLLIELVRAVDGVVAVEPHLTFHTDGTIPVQFAGP